MVRSIISFIHLNIARVHIVALIYFNRREVCYLRVLTKGLLEKRLHGKTNNSLSLIMESF